VGTSYIVFCVTFPLELVALFSGAVSLENVVIRLTTDGTSLRYVLVVQTYAKVNSGNEGHTVQNSLRHKSVVSLDFLTLRRIWT
jgi:hypothetical protein